MTQTIIPHLVVDDPAAALDFYARALGAKETMRLMMGERIGHAEIEIEGSRVMVAGEWPDFGLLSPRTRGGASSSLTVMVADVDAAYAKAVAAGATGERPPEDQFYGDRAATVRDPSGHRWSLHTPKETVPESEMQARMDAAMAAMGDGDAGEREAHPS